MGRAACAPRRRGGRRTSSARGARGGRRSRGRPRAVTSSAGRWSPRSRRRRRRTARRGRGRWRRRGGRRPRRPARTTPRRRCRGVGRGCGASAWASAVDLPSPAPATTVVTATSHRRASSSTRRRRSSSPDTDGGTSPQRRSLVGGSGRCDGMRLEDPQARAGRRRRGRRPDVDARLTTGIPSADGMAVRRSGATRLPMAGSVGIVSLTPSGTGAHSAPWPTLAGPAPPTARAGRDRRLRRRPGARRHRSARGLRRRQRVLAAGGTPGRSPTTSTVVAVRPGAGAHRERAAARRRPARRGGDRRHADRAGRLRRVRARPPTATLVAAVAALARPGPAGRQRLQRRVPPRRRRPARRPAGDDALGPRGAARPPSTRRATSTPTRSGPATATCGRRPA